MFSFSFSFSFFFFLFSVSPSLTLPVDIHKGVGGLTFIFARVLVGALVGGPGSQPTDTVDHTHSVVRALTPTLGVQPPYVCHRQRDGAVSIGSHMQQDIDNSKAPPTSRRSVPFVSHRSRQKSTFEKIGDNFI